MGNETAIGGTSGEKEEQDGENYFIETVDTDLIYQPFDEEAGLTLVREDESSDIATYDHVRRKYEPATFQYTVSPGHVTLKADRKEETFSGQLFFHNVVEGLMPTGSHFARSVLGDDHGYWEPIEDGAFVAGFAVDIEDLEQEALEETAHTASYTINEAYRDAARQIDLDDVELFQNLLNDAQESGLNFNL